MIKEKGYFKTCQGQWGEELEKIIGSSEYNETAFIITKNNEKITVGNYDHIKEEGTITHFHEMFGGSATYKTLNEWKKGLKEHGYIWD